MSLKRANDAKHNCVAKLAMWVMRNTGGAAEDLENIEAQKGGIKVFFN